MTIKDNTAFPVHAVREISKQQSIKGFIFVLLLASTVVVLVLVNKLSFNLEAHETSPSVIILNVEHYSHETSSRFLSIALDTALIRSGWIRDNINSAKLLQLTSLLAPAYLRIGGTLADCLIFNASATEPDAAERQAYDAKYECVDDGLYCISVVRNFSMSGYEWIQINNFSQKAGMELLFDLNVLLRNDEKWDPTNTKELLNFSEDHNFSASWQLGNEPNAFRHNFNVSITAQQLADDFLSLREVLNAYPSFRKSMLVGPEVSAPVVFSYPSLQFLEDFVDSADDSISAVTWHHYYVNGRSATVEDFTNSSVFNYFAEQIDAVKATLRKNTNIPLWLTETSTAYGGGARGLSDTFVAGFLWLDKLGLSARLGIDVVIRQDLYGGSYSLLDAETLDPNPDWWLSILYKSLVGRGVLETPVPTGNVRLYCHCAPPHMLMSSQSAITLFGVNISPDEVHVQLGGVLQTLPTSYVFSYILTGESGLHSKTVLLNHRPLQLQPNGSLPPFQPVVVPSTHLYMPALSMAFFVVHDTRVPGCHIK